MRFLIDTNVYLEWLLQRERAEKTDEFFYLNTIKNNQTIVTSMTLRDIEYAVKRQYHNRDEARKTIFDVYSMVSKVVSTSADAAIESIYNDVKDYEDSLQMISAEEAMCDAIITYNKKDFDKSKLPVFTPEEMIDIWKRQQSK